MRNAEVLAARIRQESGELQRAIDRALGLLEKAESRGELDLLDGVALNLHSFYAGVERIFEDIAQEIDGAVPQGADWHRKLLVQMAAEVRDTRPAVISRATYQCLDEYLRFRHVVRNAYTFNLRPERVEELTQELHPCHARLRQELDSFAHFLEELGAAL